MMNVLSGGKDRSGWACHLAIHKKLRYVSRWGAVLRMELTLAKNASIRTLGWPEL